MMAQAQKILVILFIGSLLFSCAKENSKTEPTVYVVGSDNFNAVYWKNGTEVIVPNSSLGGASGGFVSGSDVYIVGNASSTLVPTLWKNNDATLLPFTGSLARVNGMYVSGTDVYATGYQIEGIHNVPVYWKNGTMVKLPFLVNAVPNGIFVSGSDVYIVGYDGTDPVIWKNGVESILPKTIASSISQAIAVFASGSDVYVVGADNGAVIWKNGVESALPASSGSTSAYAMSLFVSGSDVYVGGYQSTNAISYASYWKNGVPTVSASANTESSSIFVSGTDVYMAGVQITVGTGQRSPLYWKNLTAVNLVATGHFGNAAFVTVK